MFDWLEAAWAPLEKLWPSVCCIYTTRMLLEPPVHRFLTLPAGGSSDTDPRSQTLLCFLQAFSSLPCHKQWSLQRAVSAPCLQRPVPDGTPLCDPLQRVRRETPILLCTPGWEALGPCSGDRPSHTAPEMSRLALDKVPKHRDKTTPRKHTVCPPNTPRR